MLDAVKEESRHFVRRVGNAICRKRIVEGMSEQELADAIGVDVVYVGRIERGSANFRLGLLEKVSRALNLSAAELLELAALERV